MSTPQRSLWEQLVTKNPMMAEVTRFRKRFLSFRGSSVAINGGIGIVLVCYALFAMACVYYRGDLDPLLLILFFLVLMIFGVPLLLHAVIAGERERRSWDMLLVAPITHSQIVIGKFMGAMAAVLMAFGLYMVPVMVDIIFSPNIKVLSIVYACIVVIMQASSLTALTLLISSRVRRPIIALGVSLAVVLLYYAFLPALVSSMANVTGNMLTGFVHPYNVLERIRMDGVEVTYRPEGYSLYDVNTLTIVATHVIYQLVITVTLLGWAIKTLVFADNEVKFIPKSKANARSKKSA